MDAIRFPHLGISLEHVGRSFSIGGFTIAYYGIIVAAAMLCGILLALRIARKTGQDPDSYFDLAIITVAVGVVGARLYYVIFSWDYYSREPLQILNLRAGGLAVYGGVIAGTITAVLVARHKKLKPLGVLDTVIPGVALGQAIGRWGNFFNREAFGRYTDSLFAMELPADAVRAGEITQEMLENAVTKGGLLCIRVHPTFLYESVLDLAVMAILLLFTFRAKRGRARQDGDVFLLYLVLYGTGRFFIEGLRTDQLRIGQSGIAVSQLLSAVFVFGGILILILRHRRAK